MCFYVKKKLSVGNASGILLNCWKFLRGGTKTKPQKNAFGNSSDSVYKHVFVFVFVYVHVCEFPYCYICAGLNSKIIFPHVLSYTPRFLATYPLYSSSFKMFMLMDFKLFLSESFHFIP